MQKGDFQILPMDGCVWLILEGAVSSEDAGGRDGGGVLGWGVLPWMPLLLSAYIFTTHSSPVRSLLKARPGPLDTSEVGTERRATSLRL